VAIANAVNRVAREGNVEMSVKATRTYQTNSKIVEGEASLLEEFYRAKGVDIHQPMPKTIRWVTLEEKNRQHEEWHRELEEFLRSRSK
jgi:hypothetical protein